MVITNPSYKLINMPQAKSFRVLILIL